MGCVADITERVERVLPGAVAGAGTRRRRERARQRSTPGFLGRINDALAASATRRDVMRNVTLCRGANAR